MRRRTELEERQPQHEHVDAQKLHARNMAVPLVSKPMVHAMSQSDHCSTHSVHGGEVHDMDIGTPIVSRKAIQTALDTSTQEKDAQIVALQTELSHTKAKLKSATLDVEQSLADNTRLQDDVAAWRGRWNGVNNELRHLKTGLQSSIDDKYLIKEWEDLHAKIVNISHGHFAARPAKMFGYMMSSTRGPETPGSASQPSSQLKQLTQDHTQYTGSDTQRPVIVQAFLWWLLANRIFDHMNYYGNGMYWAGQVRELLGGLEHEL